MSQDELRQFYDQQLERRDQIIESLQSKIRSLERMLEEKEAEEIRDRERYNELMNRLEPQIMALIADLRA
jgi:hypothetical protein